MTFLPKHLRVALGLAGLLAVSLVLPLHAQGPGSGGPQPGGSPTVIPIDGGASLLLAGGAAYALKRLRKRQ
ncbi:PID-CTERM protein-sorting domain-containing protein [Hymenobacter koreensis]